MAENVVGLKYVAEGLPEVLAGVKRYETALRNTTNAAASASRKLEQSIAKQDAEARRAFQSYLRYQREKDRLVQSEARAAEQAAARIAAANQKWTASLNQSLGVTGQRATELGATFGSLGSVLDNLEAGARRWSAGVNQSLGVTGQRATELGATFGSLGGVLDNLEAGARRWSAGVNQALGVTGQRATELGASFSALDARARAVETAYEGMLDALNPLAAAQQRYNQQLATVRAYHEQAGSSAEALTADINALNAAYARAGSPIDQYGKVTGVAGTRANTLGLVLQQTGYQVGDFAVQVQSGTNAFVAFGQQATQLAGLLYLVPGAIGVIAGTIASIGIPIITGFLAYWDRTGKKIKDVDTAVSDLSSSFNTFKTAAENAALAQDEMTQRFGEMAVAAREVYNIQRDLAALDFAAKMSQAAESARQSFGKLRDMLAEVDTANEKLAYGPAGAPRIGGLMDFDVAQSISQVRGYAQEVGRVLGEEARKALVENFGMTEAQARQLRSTLDVLSSAEGMEAQAMAARDVARAILDAANAGAQLPPQVIETARQMAVAAEQGLLFVNAQRDAADATGDVTSGLSSAANMASVLLGRAQAVSAAFAQAANNARGIGVRTEALEAENRALERGASLAEARARGAAAAERARLEAEIGGQFGGNIPRPAAARITTASRAVYERELAFQREQERNRALTALASGTGDGTGAGAAGAAVIDQQAQAFEQLRMAIDETYRAQVMFTEGKAVLDAQFADKNSAEYLRLLELLKQRYPEAAAAAEGLTMTMARLSTIMERQMEDAFMSIIDGSKSAGDAFKDMARVIISEVVRIMVVKPLVRGILGIFGMSANADGGIFSGGSRMAFANGGSFYGGSVTPFANGGVVSSPTLFPMRNGTGLMGEAGPEAIMPLKRTPSGRLGVEATGSAPVTVVQNFNIAANGDESVRRIVRAESPRIAEQAKAAVLDAKRRGGAYGRQF